jgi:predicted nicotinamide N-methyase
LSDIRHKYQTVEFENVDIHLRTLRDTQQFYDKNDEAKSLGIGSASWALFGILWPSGQVLANYIFKSDTNYKRILEVGCGIGLSSLLLNHLDKNITATDYHPQVENFLLKNTQLNSDKKIPFYRLNWEDAALKSLGKFDMIIGSDLLYEPNHYILLSNFINTYANDKCEIILVDPNRGNHSKFKKTMISFGFIHEKIDTTNYSKEPYKGSIHKYKRERKKMITITTDYRYKVLQRLLKTKESFENACSKSGLSIVQAKNYLKKARSK